MRTISAFNIVCFTALCLIGIFDVSAQERQEAKIIFLHHSTGENIWNGGVSAWFESYNSEHGTKYAIEEQAFPKDSPYGWENYPYDYWNIWVKNAGPRPFKTEPTLETLTPKYDIIVFKHCFPVSNIEPDTGSADISSSEKRIENYKLQYNALKDKMRQFPETAFIVWTGALQCKAEMSKESAELARAFFAWVRDEWDEPGDNIHIWDFYALEADNGLYLNQKYAAGRNDSHPNEAFSKKVAPMFCSRVVNVINGRGDKTSILGE